MTEENRNIIRLNELMKRGYKINELASQEVVDSLWLEHPASSRVKWPELIMYSDGLLASQSIGDEENQLRIANEQDQEFDNFARTIPRPNLWEKSAKLRVSFLAWCIMLTLWASGALFFNVVYRFIFK